jgi:hypothetical protein
VVEELDHGISELQHSDCPGPRDFKIEPTKISTYCSRETELTTYLAIFDVCICHPVSTGKNGGRNQNVTTNLIS